MLPIKIQLPEHFLEEEIRYGHLVTSKMKAIWAVELDLLVEFQRICNNNNIQWWVEAGSLLGTIRHKGFIPWDDDIDVIVPRKDYDKLCSIACKELSYPYFFQTELTDHGSMRGHAQLRNSLTTGILMYEKQKKYRFNQGVFIDIFPLDAIPDDINVFNQQLKAIDLAKKKCYQKRDFIISLQNKKRKNLIMMILQRIEGSLLNSILYKKWGNGDNYHKFEDEARKYMYDNTKLVGNLILGTWKKNWAWHREDYKRTIYLPFEFLEVPVPIGFDRRLTEQYGDWRKVIKGGSLHGEVFFDAEVPYTQYIKK